MTRDIRQRATVLGREFAGVVEAVGGGAQISWVKRA
jgi:NADPH:quinone reductase-like Zn-dependent oxidoreductase